MSEEVIERVKELFAEWLSLQGYLVETNLRLIGSREADVVGVKLEDERLMIKHVECSVQVAQKPSGKALEEILGKFGDECVETVKKIVESRLEARPKKIEYDELFITAYIGSEVGWRSRLEVNGIKLLTFHGLMREAVKAIDEWKQKKRETGNQEPNLRVSMDHPAIMLLDALPNRRPQVPTDKFTQTKFKGGIA